MNTHLYVVYCMVWFSLGQAYNTTVQKKNKHTHANTSTFVLMLAADINFSCP